KNPNLALLREDRAKIVLIRTGDAHARERSWRETEAIVDPYQAVDFGRVGGGTADRTSIFDVIDQHRKRATDFILQSLCTDVGLRGHEARAALLFDRVRNGIGQIVCNCAIDGRVREAADAIELCLADERKE